MLYKHPYKGHVEWLLCSIFFLLPSTGNAQNCPANIDFERGNFDGWTCYTGITEAVGSENVITLTASRGPVNNRHTLYGKDRNGFDRYGGFPVTCPNGSGYSVKLGSTEAGGQAEGISYEFVIPPGNNAYTLTYYYAVVFQAPHHQPNEQPRMETEVTNLTDNKAIDCASFTFIAVGSSIPGFKVSSLSDSVDVLYKDWSAVSVDLSGNAGKRIRLFFKTADCTFRRHFGYAYVDVNTECSGHLTGATYCPDDTLINVVAPFGYQNYTWYDSAMSRVLGNSQTLTVPPPEPGTTFAVKMEPYDGYGCPRTLFTRVMDSLKVKAAAGADGVSCNYDTLQIGADPVDGLSYQWTPAEGLNDPAVANPLVYPGFTKRYILSTSNSGGGCKVTDTVQVTSSIIDNTLYLQGKTAYCFGHGDSTVFKVKPAQEVQWFRNDTLLDGMNNHYVYRADQSGTYQVKFKDKLGCQATTPKTMVVIDYDVKGITYPEKYAVTELPLPLQARPIGEQVTWQPSLNLSGSAVFDPVFRGTQEQLYHIQITSKGGCITMDTQLVKIIKQVEIYVPTAFTPNNDGLNDYLRPIIRGVDNIRFFRIYNRRGQLLFESNAMQPGWDGYFRGELQSPQGLVWTLAFTGVDGLPYVRQGSTVLIR